ncbi:hypothetical protein RCL1_001462 [Eukaryota sp. TZLM3-RCL]
MDVQLLQSRAQNLLTDATCLDISPLRLAIRRKEFTLLNFLAESGFTHDLDQVVIEALNVNDEVVLSILAPYAQNCLVQFCECGNIYSVITLIEYGCQLDIPDDRGCLALVRAISCGHTSIAKLLLKAGCSPDLPEWKSVVDIYGTTKVLVYPFHAALAAGNIEIIRMLEDQCAVCIESSHLDSLQLSYLPKRSDLVIKIEQLQAENCIR